MRPVPTVVAGVLLILFTGGCAHWEDFRDNQVDPSEVPEDLGWSFVSITIPGEEPIWLPEEGTLPPLVRITTTGERQILLRHARVLGESIHGEEIYDVAGAPINLLAVPFDSVAMIERWRGSFDFSWWLFWGWLILAMIAGKARAR